MLVKFKVLDSRVEQRKYKTLKKKLDINLWDLELHKKNKKIVVYHFKKIIEEQTH